MRYTDICLEYLERGNIYLCGYKQLFFMTSTYIDISCASITQRLQNVDDGLWRQKINPMILNGTVSLCEDRGGQNAEEQKNSFRTKFYASASIVQCKLVDL